MQYVSNKDSLSKQRKEIIAKYDNGPTKNKNDNWENPQYSIYAITDYYGFIHDEGMTNEFLEKETKIKKLDCKREIKWRKLLIKKQAARSSRINKVVGSDLFSNILQRMNDSTFREELTKRIYKGIPQQFKSSIWSVFLDVTSMKNSKPKVYQTMLKKALEKSPDVHQIDLDVNRTFRNTTYFRERYNDRQNALLHVLAAYSMYNTEIGYCQGMSEIAGLLLMYLVEEEDVFWGLSQLMTSSRYCMHGIFVAGFPRLLTFFTHLNNIINKLLPKIAKHFEKLEVIASSYALKWFMQCYLDRVPLTLFLRLWDIYLLEGEKLLIAMAYNILKMHKKRLIKMDHGSILQFFQSELKKDFLYDDDFVIESLKNCIEELKKHKLSVPGPPQSNELPCKPFGTDYEFNTPSPKAIKERQIAQSNPAESIRRSLRKTRNNDTLPSGPTKIQTLQNSEEKDRPTKTSNSEEKDRATKTSNSEARQKRNESGTHTKQIDDPIPSHIRYRISHTNSKLIKTKSLLLSDEIKIEENSRVSNKKAQPISSSENRSLTKSVPDLSNHYKKQASKPSDIQQETSNPNTQSSLATVTANPNHKISSTIDSNHVNSSLGNSISKSKTTSTLSSMQHQTSISRSLKRRPISSSPETIL